MKKPEKSEIEVVSSEFIPPAKVFGVKKPRVIVHDEIEITETDPKKVDWGTLANQMTFLEFHELRKKFGLE